MIVIKLHLTCSVYLHFLQIERLKNESICPMLLKVHPYTYAAEVKSSEKVGKCAKIEIHKLFLCLLRTNAGKQMH